MKTINLFVILFALAANVAEAQTPPVGTNSSYPLVLFRHALSGNNSLVQSKSEANAFRA